MQYIHEKSLETTTRFSRYQIPVYKLGKYHNWHNHYEVVIVEYGTLKFFIENSSEPIVLDAGDMIFLKPNVLHAPQRCDSNYVSIQVINFKPEFLASLGMLSHAHALGTESQCAVCTARLSNELNNAFQSMGDLFSAGYPSNESERYLLHGYFHTVLGYFHEHGVQAVSNIQNSQDPEHHARIMTVCSYIDSHISGDLSVENLAKVAGYSPSHFHRLFKKDVGCSVKEYIDERMINEIQRMIRKKKTSITEISQLLGFSHPNNLGRMYKRITGKCLSDEIRLAQECDT